MIDLLKNLRHPLQNRSFVWHLFAFALGLFVPILIFSALLLGQFAASEHARMEDQARNLARSLSYAIDREVSGVVTTLQALATSPDLKKGHFEEFYKQALAIARVQGIHISLRKPGSTQAILGTRVPFGNLINTPEEVFLTDKQVTESRKPQVTNVFIGTINQSPTIQIIVPIMSDEAIPYVLGASIDPSYFARALRESDLPGEWIASILDRNNVFVARSRRQEDLVGKPASDDFRTKAINNNGLYYGRNSEGIEVLVGYTTSQTSQWKVAMSIPNAIANAPLKRSIVLLIGIGLVFTGLALLLSLGAGRRLSRSVLSLQKAASAMEQSQTFDYISNPVAEINQVSQALSKASKTLKAQNQALIISEQRLRRFASSDVIGIVYADIYGGITYANDEFLRIIGYSRSDLEAGLIRWDSITPPEWLTVDVERIAETQEKGVCAPYEKEYLRSDGTRAPVLVGFTLTDDKREQAVAFILDVASRKDLEERQQLLIRELHHRVKNILATVQAIAGSTIRTSTSMEDFQDNFSKRLMSLGRTHTLLTENAWRGAELSDLLRLELDHYDEFEKRISLEGPQVHLESETAVALGMGFHELATNAAKYGCLSTTEGHLTVAWSLTHETNPTLLLTWKEQGGPPVMPPQRKGFGSRLLERVLGPQISGETEIMYRTEGLHVIIKAPLPQKQRGSLDENFERHAQTARA